jgi:maleate isomerase
MIGWRARIGYISPANAECSVYEFYRIIPEGVSLVVTCLSIKRLVAEEMEAALKKVDEAAMDLARSEVDFIVLGGTPPAVLKGVGGDQQLIQRLQNATKIPTTIKITAAMAAFRHLGVKRLSLATPFEEENNQNIKRFLEGSGFTVAHMRGLGLRSNLEIAKLPVYAPYQLARQVVLENPETDAIYIPCTQWAPSFSIDQLEKDFNKPVVTPNGAMIWYVFNSLKLRGSIKGFGRLLESL